MTAVKFEMSDTSKLMIIPRILQKSHCAANELMNESPILDTP